MRFQFLACGILFLAGINPARSEEPRNALTPDQARDGWLLLFDGESTLGWSIQGPSKIESGRLILGGDKATTATCTARLPATQLQCHFESRGTGDGSICLFSGTGDKPSREIRPGEQSIFTAAPAKPEITQLKFEIPAGMQIAIHSIHLKPEVSTSLFNGRDLTGWTRFTQDPKRTASQFSVTPQGELQLKNGPGDLQTDRTFADFCLQLECKTNGKLLNSGVFFRCLKGQYQQGYEAQIHNGFRDNDRTKPTDFGTGAIYRRIATRKVVPNDLEWFTMTVLADGARLRTWVNGQPTVDWVDDRPAHENARSGRKLDAGAISLQGHDPTTDLLFRNLRITELPRAK